MIYVSDGLLRKIIDAPTPYDSLVRHYLASAIRAEDESRLADANRYWTLARAALDSQQQSH